MADILKYFLLIVGAVLIFISFWLAGEALFGELIARAREQYRRPYKLTFAGLAMALPIILLALAFFKFANNPLMNIAGVTCLGIVILGGLIGSAGLAQRIGAGLPSPADLTQPWRRVLRGGIVLVFTFLLPFIGWIGLTIWTLVTGFAALVFAVREAKADIGGPPLPKVESPNLPAAA